jgi:preprotein translocase subunit SecD
MFRLLQLNQISQSLVTTRPNHSSMTFQVKARTGLRAVVEDQADENGEVKNRRRTSKPSVKEVLITVTEADPVVVDEASEVEEEHLVETDSQGVDVEAIEAAKSPPNNYGMTITKSQSIPGNGLYFRTGFLYAIPELCRRFSLSPSGQKHLFGLRAFQLLGK